MQLILKMTVSNPLVLPMNYNFYLQSMIYDLLREDEEFSEFIHNKAYQLDNRHFKLFTFSFLRGNYTIKNKRIRFFDSVELEIRTVDQVIFEHLVVALSRRKTLVLAHQEVSLSSFRVTYHTLTDSQYHIKMLSPMIVRTTDVKSKQSRFYHPLEADFVVKLIQNARKKYKAYFASDMPSDFSLSPLQFSLQNKVVTSYKNYFLTGWRGEYLLKGDAKVLDFLYQVGLGEKNAMGFGMFKIIRKGEN